ncbi:MAG: hypothetical protein HYR88_04310 [Verrucomicrobia bacterium]|nr:hypothetical protein [Verrucomicrobiota bacterium]MBI3870271.1 hypothetical protein [Verrucomicrobiota bacterium]
MSAELRQQRERSRKSLLRANTAVAFVLIVVLGLGLAATWLGLRATRLGAEAERGRQRAEEAESRARSELWHAYLAEAKATRLGDTLDRGRAALDLIRQAAEIAPAPELRKEAVAALALPGFQLDSSLPFNPAMTAYEFDPRLERCAVGLTNGDIVLYRMKDRSEAQRLRKVDGAIPEDQGAPLLMEFSRDGRRLSARYRQGALAVWELSAGRTCFLHDADKPRGPTSRGRLSTDAKIIVGPVRNPRDGMAVFEIETGREIAFFAEFTSFRHASVRPGFPMFAANDGTNVVVVNWETGARVSKLPFEAGVRATAWSRDGKLLAIAGGLLDVHLWDIDKAQRTVLPGYKSDVATVAFDPSGERLATSCTDGSSQLWDLRDRRLLGTTTEGHITHWGDNDRIGWERHQAGLETRRLSGSSVYRRIVGPLDKSDPSRMDVTPDGNWAVSAFKREGLFIWNLRQSTSPDWVPLPGIYSLCFHPREPTAWVARRGGAEQRSYQVVTNGNHASLELGDRRPLRGVPGRRLDLVTSSLDGSALAWVELGAGRAWTDLWSRDLAPIVIQPIAHNSTADEWSSPRGSGSISLSPDGQWIACGRSGGFGVKVCDAKTGSLIAQLASAEADVQFSPDGRWLVAAGGDECALFRTGDWSRAWLQPQERFYQKFCAAFAPDSKTVAVAKAPRSTLLFDAATGEPLGELEAPDASPITSIRWASEDRLVLATRENQLDVWELGRMRRQLAALKLGDRTPGLQGPLVARTTTAAGQATLPTAWIAFAVLATVGLVAVIALLSLARHRRLIDDYSRTEALASQRERELEGEREINRLKSGFVSLVSHEFRTPLGIIQSSAQILERYLEKLPPEQRRDQLASITKNVRRMGSLIDEVLLLGKSEAGQMRFAPAPLALGELCSRLVEEMLSATHRQCPIELVAEPMPPALVDESLLRHILSNLLSNATKYSPPGSPVRLRVRREGSHAVIEVRDDGMGIPEADRAKLFTAFHRGANVGQIGGTGLGLTIVLRCVKLHGGDIAVDSQEGRGTQFTARLPVFESTGPPSPSRLDAPVNGPARQPQ